MALEINLGRYGSLPVIQLSGRVVDVDVKKLARILDKFYRKKYAQLILDVSGTDFMDSHGLGIVVYYHTLMQKAGRELLILNTNQDPNSYLRRLFELTHLDKVLRIIDSVNRMVESRHRPMPKPGPETGARVGR